MISSAALASSKRKRSSLGSKSADSLSSDPVDASSPKSRIPVKSPALGSMAVAYSPAPPSEPATVETSSIKTSQITTNPEDYSRKLQELRTAMEILKTPPKKGNQVTPQVTDKSSPLTRSWSLEHLAEKPSDSSFLRMSSFSVSSSQHASSSDVDDAQERQEIDSIISRLDQAESQQGRIEHPISSMSSVPSSPLISAEELKRRLEATREAFQRSLAQVSSPLRRAEDSDDSALDVLAQLERRHSQLRHIPVTFDDLDEEFDDANASSVESRLEELERSLSPVNLRRTSTQVDSILSELEQMREEAQTESTSSSTGSNLMIFVCSALMLVAAVALAAILKIHLDNGNLNIEKVLSQAEALLNHLLQD